jgi:DNA-binding CsgD family transcriptional regulator
MSKSTVVNHRARILEKLQLDNFVQVSRFLSMLASEHRGENVQP